MEKTITAQTQRLESWNHHYITASEVKEKTELPM